MSHSYPSVPLDDQAYPSDIHDLSRLIMTKWARLWLYTSPPQLLFPLLAAIDKSFRPIMFHLAQRDAPQAVSLDVNGSSSFPLWLKWLVPGGIHTTFRG